MRAYLDKKINFDELAKKHAALSAQDMYDVGAYAIRHILARINSGNDVNNNRMREYSEAYKKKRQKKNKVIDRVIIEWTGILKGSIKPRAATPNKVELQPDRNTNAAYHTDQDRKWWGLNNEIIKKLQEFVYRLIGSKVK